MDQDEKCEKMIWKEVQEPDYIENIDSKTPVDIFRDAIDSKTGIFFAANPQYKHMSDTKALFILFRQWMRTVYIDSLRQLEINANKYIIFERTAQCCLFDVSKEIDEVFNACYLKHVLDQV